VKYREEEVKRLVLALEAMNEAPPEKFDPKEAMRLKLEFDALMLDIQNMEAATDREFFGWLEANIPEMSKVNGRPSWIESEKVMDQDEALLKEFEDALNRNIAANDGKRHRASLKTYADLADKYGEEDAETVKQRVMRARSRQKRLNQATQDILRIAALGERDGDKVIEPKVYKRRRKKLLKAFRILTKK
jgi:hypothetical protein